MSSSATRPRRVAFEFGRRESRAPRTAKSAGSFVPRAALRIIRSWRDATTDDDNIAVNPIEHRDPGKMSPPFERLGGEETETRFVMCPNKSHKRPHAELRGASDRFGEEVATESF